jgi:hypothetical protein
MSRSGRAAPSTGEPPSPGWAGPLLFVRSFRRLPIGRHETLRPSCADAVATGPRRLEPVGLERSESRPLPLVTNVRRAGPLIPWSRQPRHVTRPEGVLESGLKPSAWLGQPLSAARHRGAHEPETSTVNTPPFTGDPPSFVNRPRRGSRPGAVSCSSGTGEPGETSTTLNMACPSVDSGLDQGCASCPVSSLGLISPSIHIGGFGELVAPAQPMCLVGAASRADAPEREATSTGGARFLLVGSNV